MLPPILKMPAHEGIEDKALAARRRGKQQGAPLRQGMMDGIDLVVANLDRRPVAVRVEPREKVRERRVVVRRDRRAQVLKGIPMLLAELLHIGDQSDIEFFGEDIIQIEKPIPQLGAVLRGELGSRHRKAKEVLQLEINSGLRLNLHIHFILFLYGHQTHLEFPIPELLPFNRRLDVPCARVDAAHNPLQKDQHGADILDLVIGIDDLVVGLNQIL